MESKNQIKVNNFLADLQANQTVINVADYFNKSVNEVYKLIQKFIVILYYRNGDIKQIKIDFLEQQSNIKIFQNSKF